jgi:hypothetical protein
MSFLDGLFGRVGVPNPSGIQLAHAQSEIGSPSVIGLK